MDYSYFSRIIEVQYKHVHTLITLLPSCRTFRWSGQPFDSKQKSKQEKIKNATPKTVYGIITKTDYVFIREIMEGTSDGIAWGRNDVCH